MISKIGYAMSMAKEFYNKDTYDHVMRVATYIAENRMIPEDIVEDCMALAMMHELFRFEYREGLIDSFIKDLHFRECLGLLYDHKNMDYMDFIKNIRMFSDNNPEIYWVMLADIKDNLTIKDDKDTYIEAILHLL